jgi:SAM-dependent methyltransferase
MNIKEKIWILYKIISDSRFRKDVKALKYANEGYKVFAWDLCKEVNIIELLNAGASINEIIKRKNIKNKLLLEHILDLLVGTKVLKYEKGKYILIKEPKPFVGKKYNFLKKYYPYSVKWTEELLKKAKETLLTGKKHLDTGFNNEKFLRLWEGIMYESPWSFRKIAIKKFCKKIVDNAKILDLGCGSGVSINQILYECKKPVYITGIDISESSLRRAKKLMNKLFKICSNPIVKENIKKVRFLKYDLSKEFPKDEKYDVVFMSLLVHHIPKNKRYTFFKNVKKLLEDDGVVVVYQIIHKSKFERAPMWVMHMIPSHQEYPFKDEYLKMFYEIFGEVKDYLDGTIVVAKK